MLPTGSATNRRTTFIFVCGMVLGFLVTYSLYQKTSELGSVPRKLVPNFIPDAPHSHGQTDTEGFVGPDQEQTWHDFGEHHHHGNNLLFKK